MDTNLCIVCTDYNKNENETDTEIELDNQNENENYNTKKFKVNYIQKEDIENIPNNFEIEKEEDIRFDILLDNQKIKKNIKNISEEEMICYLQKYHDFNFFKKYNADTFNKINIIVDGIHLYKL